MAEPATTSPTKGGELNLYQKLAAITGEIGVIAKDGKNREQDFAFIEYAAVAGRLRELFAKYGVVVIPRMQVTKKQNREQVTSKYGKAGEHVLIDMYFEVINADSPTDRFTAPWTGEATDFGDKSTNKAATSALKYFLMRLFNVSEKGEDPDEHSPESTPAPKEQDPPVVSSLQKARIFAILRKRGIDAKDMPEYLLTNYETDLSKIDAAQADSLITAMEADHEA